jgi:hypothetical protein
LDLRPQVPDFNGPLGWIVTKLGFWSPQPIEAASEVTRPGLPIDPEAAAREFVVRDGPLPAGRLDLVVAYVGSPDEEYPDAGQLRTLGKQVRALRTDGTLGLLCVTTDEHSQSVADLGDGPFDFVIRLGTTATEVIPELVEVLQTAMESLDELQGGYDVGVSRVSPRRDSEPFEVISDLGARTLKPLFGEQWEDPPDHCVVSTPERFATGIRTAIKPASLLEWTNAVDEVRMVGFRQVE